MDLLPLARSLAVFGLILLVIAGIIFLAARTGISLGRLPGDLVIKRENFSCVIPLASSLIISLVLTLLVNILIALVKK